MVGNNSQASAARQQAAEHSSTRYSYLSRFSNEATNLVEEIIVIEEDKSAYPISQIPDVRSQIIEDMVVHAIIEANEPDWDGYGGARYDLGSANAALQFLSTLPLKIKLPEGVGCEPSGRMGMEWSGKDSSIAVAFNGDGTLVYGGVGKDGHLFSGKDSNKVIQKIRDVISDA